MDVFFLFRRWRNRTLITLKFVFGMTRREISGMMILCPLVLLWAFYPEWSRLFRKTDTIEMQKLEALRTEWIAPEDTIRMVRNDHPFDPDTISAVSLTGYGLPETVIKNFIHYRESLGGHFHSTDQIEKVFGMNDSLFAFIDPYLRIKKSPSKIPVAAAHYTRPVTRLDINLADTLVWRELYGIGPVLSRRIVRYRDLLGGFIDPHQLLEVYGIDSVLFDQISPLIYSSNEFEVHKLPLNTAGYQELRQHPYLTSKQASAVFYFRSQHGPFSTIEDLCQVELIDSLTFKKIRDYLMIGPY